MNLYVGNLAYTVTETDLQTLFGEYGHVARVSLIKDKYTGQSKGFGFVEMEKQADAEEAIKRLNGRAVGGRDLQVNQARPREERSTPKPKRW